MRSGVYVTIRCPSYSPAAAVTRYHVLCTKRFRDRLGPSASKGVCTSVTFYAFFQISHWQFIMLIRCKRNIRNILCLTKEIINHGLRGSASPVLTATGFVTGRGQFSTPTESTPLDRSPNNLLLVITSATPTAVPNLVQIRPRGLLGKWVKYNEFFF